MADRFLTVVNKVIASLCDEECRILQYLCADLFTNSCVDLRGALLAFDRQTQNQAGQHQTGDALLRELMFQIKRFDILKKVLGANRQQVEKVLLKCRVISDYRVLMAEMSENLDKDDLQSFIFLLSNVLPKERMSRATNFLDVVVELEKLDEVSCDKLDLLEKCLKDIQRNDLVKRMQALKNKGQRVQCTVPSTVQNPFNFTPGQPPTVKPVKQPQCFSQEFKNLKVSVPETGIQHPLAREEEYEMNPEQKGLCVIIDCVGIDGQMLKRTFEHLGFRVNFHSLLGWKDTQKALEDVIRPSVIQRVSSLVCCVISRGTETHLLATDCNSLGISLENLKQLFDYCPSLFGKPKLFFTQIYKTTETPLSPSMDDEYLENDSPTFPHSGRQCSNPPMAVSGDILWSLCTAEAKLLEESEHQSVYLHALNSSLLRGHERKMLLLDVVAEVNRHVCTHNQQNPHKAYHHQLFRTLRKNLYL